jgi:hypothetical protein
LKYPLAHLVARGAGVRSQESEFRIPTTENGKQKAEVRKQRVDARCKTVDIADIKRFKAREERQNREGARGGGKGRRE